jgi:tRNA threonylcarbamoyl adenosine modification protein (Sua5/YciO/YrdC/YwlC family)
VGELLTLANEDRAAAKDSVLRCLRNGEVAVVATEFGYAYIADAFNISAVDRIHAIRRADAGTACQVLVGSAKMASGVSRNFDDDVAALTATFWPGGLTFLLAPQQGLTWNLGDNGALDEFAVRTPAQPFLLELLQESGPLAVASASVAGRPSTLDINFVPALPSDVGIYIDEGTLAAIGNSTVVRNTSSGLQLVREGAISYAALTEVVSHISPLTL